MGKVKRFYDALRGKNRVDANVEVINHGGFIDSSVRIIGSGILEIGEGAEIRANAVLEFGDGELRIGKKSVIGYGCFVQLTGAVKLGEGVLVGPGSCLIASIHGSSLDKKVYQQPMTRGEITIEDDVWIGANVTIDCNTHIASSSIIGANAFINKNIPTKEVWAGVPCKKIKNR